MASRISSSRIVGLSWSKMDSPLDTDLKKGSKKSKNGKENVEYEDIVVGGIKNNDDKKRESVKVAANKAAKAFGERILKTINEAETATNTALVKRANMVKSAVTSIKQKLKSSTRRRKRLVTATPSPFKADLVLKTPEGVTRSGRLIRCQDVKMYSPFGFDSPLYNRTPKPKMGLGDSKPKLLLASPEGIGNSLANDLEALANLSDGWSTPGTGKKLTRSKIRTTPRSSRRSMRSKKPLFP